MGRRKRLVWKKVKHIFICDLHFESHDAKRLNFNVVSPLMQQQVNEQVQNDHDYVNENNLLKEEGELQKELRVLKQANYYLKRKNNMLQSKLSDFQTKVKDLHKRYELSYSLVESLHNCTSEVPKEIFELTSKRARGISMKKDYHPAIRKFALTLHLCSATAYR